MSIIAAGALYFLVTFGVGFIFGVVRELLITPTTGPALATAIEAPVMCTVCYLAARWVVRRTGKAWQAGQRLMIGLVAFACLIAAEIGLSRLLRGWDFARWLEHLHTAEGRMSLVLFAIFAALPVFVRRA